MPFLDLAAAARVNVYAMFGGGSNIGSYVEWFGWRPSYGHRYVSSAVQIGRC